MARVGEAWCERDSSILTWQHGSLCGAQKRGYRDIQHRCVLCVTFKTRNTRGRVSRIKVSRIEELRVACRKRYHPQLYPACILAWFATVSDLVASLRSLTCRGHGYVDTAYSLLGEVLFGHFEDGDHAHEGVWHAGLDVWHEAQCRICAGRQM